MSQQFIDFGTFPNDPAADPIRSAFQKIQNNFSELYSTTLVSGVSNVYVGQGLYSPTDTYGNVFIQANIPNVTLQTANGLTVGVGTYSTGTNARIETYVTPFVVGLGTTISTVNSNFSGNVRTGNLNVANSVTSSLVPNANVTYDLGTPSNRWRDLYLSEAHYI